MSYWSEQSFFRLAGRQMEVLTQDGTSNYTYDNTGQLIGADFDSIDFPYANKGFLSYGKVVYQCQIAC